MNGYGFSENVRESLAQARREAVNLGHEFIGTEHILLGIIANSDNIASSLLAVQNVSADTVRSRMTEIVKGGRGSGGPDLPYTSRAKRIIELSMAEARDLNGDSINTGHLFLGVMREEKGIAASVLADFGFTLDAVRLRLIEMAQAGRTEPLLAQGMNARSAPLAEMHPLHAATMLGAMLRSPRIASVFAKHNVDVPALIRDLSADQPRS